MFEGIVGVIRSSKSTNDRQKERTKGLTMIYKILHSKLKIEQNELH